MTKTLLALTAILWTCAASAAAKPLPCTSTDGETYRACLERKGEKLRVQLPVVQRLTFSDGLASVYSKQTGWVYLDRSGAVVVENVAPYDNGPDAFHDGLVRVERGGKCGYADKTGRQVAPAMYDGCFPFENARGRVCVKCRKECDGKDCEHRSLKGGEWFCLDASGRRAACAKP